MRFRLDALANIAMAGAFTALASCSDGTKQVVPPSQKALAVVVSQGVTGFPSQGTTSRDQGGQVDYSYALASGFTDLIVSINGKVVAPSGSVTLDAATTIVATALRAPNVQAVDFPIVATASAIVSSSDPVSAFKIHAEALSKLYQSTTAAGASARVSEIERQAALISTATQSQLAVVHGKLSNRTFWLQAVANGASARAATVAVSPITYLYVNGILSKPSNAVADALAFRASIDPLRSADDAVGLFYNASWRFNSKTPEVACVIPLWDLVAGDESAWVAAQRVLKCLQAHSDKFDLQELMRQLVDVEYSFIGEAEPDAKLLAAAILEEVDQNRRVIVVAHSQGNLMTQQALAMIQKTALPGLNPLPCIGVLRYAPPSSHNWIVQSNQHLGGFVIDGDITRSLGLNTDMTPLKTTRSSALLALVSEEPGKSNLLLRDLIIPSLIHFAKAGYIENAEAKSQSASDIITLQTAVRAGDGCGGAFKVILASSGQDNGDGPSNLFLVPPVAGETDQPIGAISTPAGERPPITDLAWCPGGRLFALSYDRLFFMIPSIGTAIEVAHHGRTGANSLTCDPSGTLYMGAGSALYRFDGAYAATTRIGFATHGNYSGDIAFNQAGKLFATLVGTSTSDRLVEVNPQTGTTSLIGNIGFANVWGLTFVGDVLYGLTTSSVGLGTLIRINTSTGIGTRIRSLSFDAFGSTIRAPIDGGH